MSSLVPAPVLAACGAEVEAVVEEALEGHYRALGLKRLADARAVTPRACLDRYEPALSRSVMCALDPRVRNVRSMAIACRAMVVAIDKRYPGQARRVMMGLWSILPQFSMTKLIIVCVSACKFDSVRLGIGMQD